MSGQRSMNQISCRIPSYIVDFFSDCFYSALDLHMVIRAGILADIHKKYIIWQLLKALKYLHSAGS
jgi:serine/threonine protein kinase